MEPYLQWEDVSYHYPGGQGIEHVSLQLDAGERVAVLGSNGAGKSTFLLCCNGVLRPQQGKILLHGRPVGRKEQRELRRSVGLVLQDSDSQIVASTVEQEVSFGPMNLRLSRPEVQQRVDETLKSMGAEHLRNRTTHQLSGGEKKRVGIAGVLAMWPGLLLLDEPQASLDPAGCALLEQQLEQLHRQGMGLVISTHDIDFAWRWAERVLLFYQGRLVVDEKPERVFADVELLHQCGLQQPLLWRVARALGKNGVPPREPEGFSTAL